MSSTSSLTLDRISTSDIIHCEVGRSDACVLISRGQTLWLGLAQCVFSWDNFPDSLRSAWLEMRWRIPGMLEMGEICRCKKMAM